jgi:hypothetical protein
VRGAQSLAGSRQTVRIKGTKPFEAPLGLFGVLFPSCRKAAPRANLQYLPLWVSLPRPLDRGRVPSFEARIPLLGKFFQRTRSRRKKRMSWARFGSETPRSPEGTCGTALESICRAVLEKLIPRWQLAFRTQVEVFHRAFPQEALRDRHGTKYTWKRSPEGGKGVVERRRRKPARTKAKEEPARSGGVARLRTVLRRVASVGAS